MVYNVMEKCLARELARNDKVRTNTTLTVNMTSTIISAPSGMAEGLLLAPRGRENKMHRLIC